MAGKIPIRIGSHAYRHALPVVNLRNRLFRNVDAHAQGIQADYGRDFLLRRNILTYISRTLCDIASHRRRHDCVTKITFRQRQLALRGIDRPLRVGDRCVVLLGLVN